ncbi:hypothetical protein CEXT_64801 [Caerostris extrusa]|uniref:Uncharacterized protein n=1 Tax=Caerostris extrusa TaxID=172846 RepID=A0AAV4Y9I2_CAEEX|nr:hypothetical protein CEXT_64801 [Caerostris extrusa]
MKVPLGRESEIPNSIPLSDLRIHPQHEAKDLIRRPPNPKGWPAIKRSPTTNAETMNNLIIPLIPLLSSPRGAGCGVGGCDYPSEGERNSMGPFSSTSGRFCCQMGRHGSLPLFGWRSAY